MIKQKYLNFLTQEIIDFTADKELKFFIFGSCLRKDHFGDVDIGVLGNNEEENLTPLKSNLENSTFPYFVDIVDFNKVSEGFKQHVLNSNILWLKH